MIFYFTLKTMKNLKHLFLLLFLSIATLQAQTRSEIQDKIETVATGVPNTALKIRTVLSVLADGIAQTGDVKEIDVATSYINDNFDPTGLGINERLGWAICNGNNGTRNRSGRVAMQYSSLYPVLGSVGGSVDATLVNHSHFNGIADDASGLFVYGSTTSEMPGSANRSTVSEGNPRTYQGNTSTAGESGAGKNMQPYIVTLMIMKL